MDDKLNNYMRQLGDYEPLPRTVQTRLFRQAKKGDAAARERLIHHNLRLVPWVVRKGWQPIDIPFEDLIQWGNLGLMIAIDKYDPERGVAFATYAPSWIRQQVQRGIENSRRVVRLPVHIHAKLNEIKKAREQLSLDLDRNPTTAELASAVDMTETKLSNLISETKDVHSLDAPLAAGLGDYTEFISDPRANVEEEAFADTHDLEVLLNDAMRHMDPRMVSVLQLRYGTHGLGTTRTLEEVAKKIGKSRGVVDNIQKQGIKFLQSDKDLWDKYSD